MTRIQPIIGDPDPAHISTSCVERHNLAVGMGVTDRLWEVSDSVALLETDEW